MTYFYIATCVFWAAIFRAIKEQTAHHPTNRITENLNVNGKWWRWFNGDGLSWQISNDNIFLFSWWRIFKKVPSTISDSFHFFKFLEMLCFTLAISIALFRDNNLPLYYFFLIWLFVACVSGGTMRYFYLFLNPRKTRQ